MPAAGGMLLVAREDGGVGHGAAGCGDDVEGFAGGAEGGVSGLFADGGESGGGEELRVGRFGGGAAGVGGSGLFRLRGG